MHCTYDNVFRAFILMKKIFIRSICAHVVVDAIALSQIQFNLHFGICVKYEVKFVLKAKIKQWPTVANVQYLKYIFCTCGFQFDSTYDEIPFIFGFCIEVCVFFFFSNLVFPYFILQRSKNSKIVCIFNIFIISLPLRKWQKTMTRNGKFAQLLQFHLEFYSVIECNNSQSFRKIHNGNYFVCKMLYCFRFWNSLFALSMPMYTHCRFY